MRTHPLMPRHLAATALLLSVLLACCSAPSGRPGDRSTAGTAEPLVTTPWLHFQGANLSGAEQGFGSEIQESWGPAIPGAEGQQYAWPDPDSNVNDQCVDTLIPDGFATYRLPFQWERIQPALMGPLDPTYLARLHITVDALRTRGANVLLDIHNYGYYKVLNRGTAQPGQSIGAPEVPVTALADVWTRLAMEFGSPSRSSPILFGLMNEPHGLSVQTWVDAAQGAVNGIRAAGAANVIFVPGADWTTANDFSWSDNRNLLQSVVDPIDNFAIEVHQYADDCDTNAAAHVSRLAPFEQWAVANHRLGFLGETNMKQNTTNCQAEFRSFLQHMTATAADKSGGVWIGWTYWTVQQGPSAALGTPGYAVPAIRTNLPATCANGTKDGLESDVDCGGRCRRCADGKNCTADYECQGGFCTAGRCGAGPADGGASDEGSTSATSSGMASGGSPSGSSSGGGSDGGTPPGMTGTVGSGTGVSGQPGAGATPGRSSGSGAGCSAAEGTGAHPWLAVGSLGVLAAARRARRGLRLSCRGSRQG